MQYTETLSIQTQSPIKRESLTEQTIRAIREAILNGTYSLGQKLPENEFVSRLGVSSSVIREALHVLQGQGIIVTKPYCGRSVFNLTPEESDELIVMRASLESYAAYLAAHKITPAAAKKILVAAGRFLSDPPVSYTDWVDRELSFHGAVWEASRNEWLIRQLSQFSLPTFALRIIETTRKDIDAHRFWQDSQLRETEDNPQGHQLLARTVVAGDAVQSRMLMVVHIRQSSDQVQRDMFPEPWRTEQMGGLQ